MGDSRWNRRRFLADVGKGMLVAGLGQAAVDMELAPAFAGEEPAPIRFGELEPLVALMQETSIDRLLPTLVAQLQAGTELKRLVAAAAYANARAFGGEDYVGFHTMMALAPSYHMSTEMPQDRQALPVLKVLYRNTSRIQDSGSASKSILHPLATDAPPPVGGSVGEAIRAAVRRKDLDAAERMLASVGGSNPEGMLEAVLYTVGDNTEVHRTVMPYRAWDLLGIVGREHALTLLRQSVHYCVKSERDWQHNEAVDRPRTILPRLFDQYKIASLSRGTKPADDAWVDRLSRTFFESDGDGAADAAAAALAEGIEPDAIGEAISLAANQLILRDAGRPKAQEAYKPAGSTHGDSIGVHACDSANAWRNMARVGSWRNTAACLILGAYQVANDRVNRGGDFLHWEPRPHTADIAKITTTDPDALRRELDTAIRAKEQDHACAVAQRIGDLGLPSRPVFDLLLGFAVSEDGALHAEKFYRTTSEEFAANRPAFRWRQLVALARVSASEFGKRAPGIDEAIGLLKV